MIFQKCHWLKHSNVQPFGKWRIFHWKTSVDQSLRFWLFRRQYDHQRYRLKEGNTKSSVVMSPVVIFRLTVHSESCPGRESTAWRQAQALWSRVTSPLIADYIRSHFWHTDDTAICWQHSMISCVTFAFVTSRTFQHDNVQPHRERLCMSFVFCCQLFSFAVLYMCCCQLFSGLPYTSLASLFAWSLFHRVHLIQ